MSMTVPPAGRLIVTRVVLEDFKSYAGRQVIGPFDPRFTSIIGPNGSGKSNVIDAMLFVFGSRAHRMRHQRLSGLIHKSAGFPNVRKARVEVHFCRTTATSAIPDTDFFFAREVYADGTTTYFWNNGRSSLADVADFLRSEGLDLEHSRFLILQGEIDTISMMKPKATSVHHVGLLEYIEQIVGTDSYIPKIDETDQKLRELCALRCDAIGRLRFYETERDSFEKAKKEAQRYLELRNEVANLKIGRCSCEKQICEEQIADLTNRRSRALQKLDDAHGDESAETAKLKELTDKRFLLDKQLQRDRKKLSKADGDLRKLENREAELQLQLDHLDRVQSDTQREITLSVAKRDKSTSDICDLESQISQMQVELTQKTAELEAAQSALDLMMASSRDKVSDVQNQLLDAQVVLSQQQSSIGEVEQNMRLWQHEVDLLTKSRRELDERLSQKLRQVHECEMQISLRAGEIDRLADEIVRQTEGKVHFEEVMAEKQALLGQLEEVRRDLSRKHAELEELANQRTTNSRVQTGMLEFRAVQEGIFGRLGDLGDIDAKYEIAVSAAATGRLDFMVVDVSQTAKNCVLELERKNFGKTTFIILEMLAAVQAFVPPKGSQRLFDLVRPKERRFAPAFFYALQNTLVVADIDVARQIALHSSDNKRYRVVTMDGNLIETSGTISGGGKPSQRAGMRRFNQEKFDEIQANLAQVDGQIRDAKREVREIADELHKRRPEQLQTQQDKHQLDLQGLRDKILVLESQIEELRIRLQSKDDEPRLQELQELIRENSPEFDSKMSGIQETQELIRKLERQIEDSLTGDMKAQKAVVRELESNCDRLKKSISRNTGKINALLQTGERFAQSLEDSQKYVSDSLSERSSVWPQLEEVRELKQKAKSFADELRSNVKEHESQTEGLNDEIELTNGTIQTILLSVAEFEQKLSKLDSGLRTAKQQIERLSKKIESCDSLDSVPTFSDVKEYDREIAVIDHELTQMQPNLTAIEEWNRRDAQYQHYLAEVERLTKARDQTQSHGEELKVTRCQTFLKGLLTIGEKVKETYQLLTLGGDAELDCVNRQDPFAEGLDFTVRPPGKSWKHISNLSGGEKTLSSLALVFALHSFKETPLYIMDEIDAALDFRNVSIIAHYLRSRTTNAQVIVISLRNNLFELANKLVGIIKVNDCTTSLTISPSTFGNPDSNDPIQNVDRFPLD